MKQNKMKIILTVLVSSLLLASHLPAQKNPKDTFDFPKLNEIKMPAVKQMTLKNGLKLFLVEDHDFPTISMRGMIATGSVYEPAGKKGLADLTGTVLRTGGTIKMTGDQIDKTLETMAAVIETGIGETSGSIRVSMLKENLDQVLPIMNDILRNPVFAQEKIDLAKNELRAVISRRNDDIGGITNREFEKLIYGADSPYARQIEYADLDAIQQEDIVAFYKKQVHPNHMMLAVWGDFNTRQMVKKLETVLGAWPSGPAQKPQPPAVDYKYVSTANHIEKSDVNQSNIMIGHIGGLMNNADYPALSVMNRILSFDRMFKKIRTDEGLAYNVWGNYGVNYQVPGVFSAGAQTKSESTVKAIHLMLKEIQKITEQEVSEEELKRAKDQFLNTYVFQFQSKGQIINRMLTYAFFGYPLDFSQQMIKKIEGVTRADILQAAKKYLHPDKLQILVVGKKADFDQPLSTLGTVRSIDITIPVPKGEETPAATKETLEKGRQVFEKAVATIGDPARIKAVTSMYIKLQSQKQGMTMDMEGFILYPDKFRMIMNMPMGVITIIANGQTVIADTPQGKMPLPDVQKKSLEGDLIRDLFYIWKYVDQFQIQFAGKIRFEDQDALDLIVSGMDNTFHFYVDPKDFRIIGSQYDTFTQTGPATVQEIFSDFREVDGFRLSFKSVSKVKGEIQSESQATEIKFNVEMKEDLFKTE